MISNYVLLELERRTPRGVGVDKLPSLMDIAGEGERGHVEEAHSLSFSVFWRREALHLTTP